MTRLPLVAWRSGSVLSVAVAFSAAAAQQPTPARDVAGTWTLLRAQFDNLQWTRLRITRDADSLIVSSPAGSGSGRLTGNRLSLVSKAADGRVLRQIDARLEGDSLVGTSVEGTRTWDIRMTRERVRPRSAPSRQTFIPDHFSSAFTSAASPVLHIWSGDTVRTETGGPNAKYAFGNALTGPFFIEGALPGDELVVHLLRVRTNRPTAVSGGALTWWGVQPWYFAAGTGVPPGDGTWTIDTAAGVARLAKPSEGLRDYSIPLRPMLGCIGVAPENGESHHGGALGYWGGNLDYNRIVEGATVMLQVNQPGALLFIGDGHAAQGQGELTGAGLETTLDVEFSIEVIREKRIGSPKIVDALHLMSPGIGGSLDDAFRSATTSMASWLQAEFTLTRSDVALVMGTAIEYDIAEVVDGGIYNVVARMPKAALRGIVPRAASPRPP